VASAPPAPRAIRKPCVSGASEDFVPPAAQRKAVRPTGDYPTIAKHDLCRSWLASQFLGAAS